MDRKTTSQTECKRKQAHIPKARPMSSDTRHYKYGSHNDSVPPLSLHNRLEIQSSPIHLATRSLSARSSSSTHSSLPFSFRPSSAKSQESTRLPKDSKRPSSSVKMVRHAKKAKKTALVHPAQLLNNESNRKPNHTDIHSLAPKATPLSGTEKGFNIAGHLQDAGELDRSSGSLSPDVDQFLKDIGALARPLTPDTNKELQDTTSVNHPSTVEEANHSHTLVVVKKEAAQKTKDTTSALNGVPKKSLRPRVAANFGAGSEQVNQAETKLDGIHKCPDPTLAQVNSITTLQPQEPHATHPPDPSTGPPTHSTAQEPPDQNVAATKIQSWYRRVRSARYAKLQSVLQEKRDELNRSKAQELVETESKEIEKRQRRAAKMQAARRAAIEELNKKREEKRLRAEKIVQEEIALLQASGKIKKMSRKKPTKLQMKSVKADTKSKSPEAPDQVIDEFFQAGSSRLKSPQPPSSSESSPLQPASTQSKPKNTYDNILETLKLLEEEPAPFSSGRPPTGDPAKGYLSAENLQKLVPSSSAPLSSSASLSEGKLSNILAYLDEMEKADQDLLSQLSKSRAEIKTRGVGTASSTPRVTKNTPRGKSREGRSDTKEADASLEAATAAASDVTTTILAQRIELDNKNKTIEMMQKALSQQRELTVYHAKEMEKDGQKKLDLLKTEYESRIQRHQSFIDQLIDDKKVLSERCEQLVKQLRELDKKYKTNLKATEEKHSTEISKLKQVTAAAEKLRRDKWKSDETQRIKEATVKSLEPEIQRIIAKGKAEVQKLKALHEAEMMQVDERASRRFVAQMEELRAQCAEEKEQACAHERELARQRYEKMAEQEEVNYQQLRRKLFAEVQQEKNRLADQFQQQKLSTDQRVEDMQQTHRSLLEELKAEHTRQLSEIDRRHGCEIKDLTERSKVEKQAWEENVLKKQEAEMLAKERSMREQLRKERDKEIELVITRLEEETTASREELERAAEARVRRVREKYETELREVERSERSTLEKFNNLKTQVVEHEGELSRLRTLLRQKQEEVEHVSEVASKLTRERDSVADIVRQEFADRLVRTEEENKDIKIEMSELRARHKVELEKVAKEKDREMESVHDRVKQALNKKEDNLRSLREQYESALKRADHLEMLLEQQRKQLLKK